MEHIPPLSDGAEVFLRLIEGEYWLEEANQTTSIGANRACKFPTLTDARLAMLREAYVKGRDDALKAPDDFERDLAMVAAINAQNRDE